MQNTAIVANHKQTNQQAESLWVLYIGADKVGIIHRNIYNFLCITQFQLNVDI